MKKRLVSGRCLMLLILLFGLSIYAGAQVSISGKVTSQNEPVPGVTVLEEGTSNGSITDMDGNYSIKVAGTQSKLVFSSIGFKTQTIPVGNNITINVVLEDELSELDEVVVIGYGSVKKKDLTGATVSIGSDQMVNIPSTTAAQALTGKVAGVSVVSNSGAPGASVNILVRGGTSITQSTSPLYIVDGFVMDDALTKIDVNDIASIDIMKDASATAIYGAQGSNGVIIISTKSAKSGKTQINYNSYYSFEKLGKKLDVLKPKDYVEYQYELQTLQGNEESWASWFYSGEDVGSSSFYTSAYDYIQNTYGNVDGIDWQEEVFGGTSVTQNHNISITGGSDKTNFFVSYNFTDQDGIISKHGYTRNSFRAKLNHELWKGATFKVNADYQNTDILGGGSLGGNLKMTILQPPTGGIKYTDEEMLTSDIGQEIANSDDTSYDIYNPIITNDAVTDKDVTNRIGVNASLSINFLKDFTFLTSGSYSWTQLHSTYWDDGRTSAASNYGGAWGTLADKISHSYQFTNTLSWLKELGAHSFNVLLGQEVHHSSSYKSESEYHNFDDANFGLNDLSMGEIYDYSSSSSKSAIVSGFGRVMYNYLGKYLFTGTVRADGSSKFAKGHHWGYFPSASAAWRISEENFMKNLTFINNLKIRYGYGESGNCSIDNNLYATNYSSSYYTINGSTVTGLNPGSTLGNPNIQWETIVTSNLGLDLSVLDSRINLSLDYYNNKSQDLLLDKSIPTSTGYSTQMQNIGSLRNSGVELILNTVNVKTASGFTWTSNFNISFNKSKVLSIGSEGTDDTYFYETYSNLYFKIEEGKPLGQFYGYKSDGVFTTDQFTDNGDGTFSLNDGEPSLKGATRSSILPGDIKYKCIVGDTDDDGNPVWSTDDRTVIGSAEPDFTGGFKNTFSYKGFDFSVFMNFCYGNELFNMSSQRFIGPYKANQNTMSVTNSRFKLIDPNTGEEALTLSRLAELNSDQYSSEAMWSLHSDNKIAITAPLDYYLEDGSYLRIKEITLGYSLPKRLINKAYMNSLRVYCTLNNMFLFTNYSGYDPEVSVSTSLLTRGVDNSSYPRSKGVTFGLNLTF